MSPTTTKKLFEQLDYRENDGIEVSLIWSGGDKTLTVYVCDSRTGDIFEFAVEPARALDAFCHPFAYRQHYGTAAAAAELAA